MNIKKSFRKIRKVLSSRKGITPIISVILLLMMTIAIAGLAFTFLQRIQGDVENQTSASTQDFLGSAATQLRIDGTLLSNCSVTNQSDVTIFVRNIGTGVADNVQLFLDDVFISGASISTILPGTQARMTADSSFILDQGDANLSGLFCKTDFINKTKSIRLSADQGNFESSFFFGCNNTGSYLPARACTP